MRIIRPIPEFLPGIAPSKRPVLSCSRWHLILCDWVVSDGDLTRNSLKEICGDEAREILVKLKAQGYAKPSGRRWHWGLTNKGRQDLALRKEITNLVFDPTTCLYVRPSCKRSGPALRARHR